MDISVATGDAANADNATTTKINANAIADRSVTDAAYQRLAGTSAMLSTPASYIQANGDPYTAFPATDSPQESTLGAYFEYLNGRIELLGNYENVGRCYNRGR